MQQQPVATAAAWWTVAMHLWLSPVTKRSLFLLVLHCASGVWDIHPFPIVSTIIRQVQKELGRWHHGLVQSLLLSEIPSATTESVWFGPHLSKLPTACVWLLKGNEDLILGEGTDCVCTWQPTSCYSWDCLRHSVGAHEWAHLTEKKMSILSKESLNLSTSGRNIFPSLPALFKTLDGTEVNIRA